MWACVLKHINNEHSVNFDSDPALYLASFLEKNGWRGKKHGKASFNGGKLITTNIKSNKIQQTSSRPVLIQKAKLDQPFHALALLRVLLRQRHLGNDLTP